MTLVIRRVGGLEEKAFALAAVVCVIRRVGGLEEDNIRAAMSRLVIRRVGGLEVEGDIRVGRAAVIRPRPRTCPQRFPRIERGTSLSAYAPLQADGQKKSDPHQCEPPFVWGHSSPSYGVTSSTL